MPGRPASASAQPVHSFKPTSGTAVGLLGLLTAVFVIVLAASTERTLFGLRAGIIAALAGLLAWMTLLRPRVKAYADTLMLRNMASDTYLPLARIDNVLVRHTLNVWVDDRRYSCAGIGRSTRSIARARARGPEAVQGDDYVTFVETTIEDLARSARRDLRGAAPPVRTQWAIPELVALAVLTLGLVLSFTL